MLLKKSGEITPERMKRQSKSSHQLWVLLATGVKSEAEAVLQRNLEC